MTGWLDPFRRALDDLVAVEVFFRDDDAGWDDPALRRLLARFDAAGVPVDVAVIPQACDQRLARELCNLAAARPGFLGLHQHGLAHLNHEPSGRRQEFGPARPPTAQRADILQGRRRLEQLGLPLDSIFTPPWNRCTPGTGRLLAELGFRALSREACAEPLGEPALVELPIRIDWAMHRHGIRLPLAEIGVRLAAEAGSGAPLGIMLHHAAMGEDDLAAVDELLRLLADDGRVHCRRMASLVTADAALEAV